MEELSSICVKPFFALKKENVRLSRAGCRQTQFSLSSFDAFDNPRSQGFSPQPGSRQVHHRKSALSVYPASLSRGCPVIRESQAELGHGRWPDKLGERTSIPRLHKKGKSAVPRPPSSLQHHSRRTGSLNSVLLSPSLPSAHYPHPVLTTRYSLPTESLLNFLPCLFSASYKSLCPKTLRRSIFNLFRFRILQIPLSATALFCHRCKTPGCHPSLSPSSTACPACPCVPFRPCSS
jgi:hypothetical protein